MITTRLLPATLAGTLALAAFTAADSVEKVASMNDARSVHTATTLASGRVLLAGGMAGGGASMGTAELFDPATNRLASIGSLTEPRASHTATRLPNGKVLIAGGFADGRYLATVETFDPATSRFARAGALTTGRSGHTATLLPDGRILVIGGVGDGWTFLASAEIHDPATGRSQSVGSMRIPRESHTANLLADGRVLVIGGHHGRRQNMRVHAEAEIFSPVTGQFTDAGSLDIPRHKHDAVGMADGRVLVIGGADRTDRTFYASTEIFDVSTGRFTTGPTMASSRYKIAGTSLLLPTGEIVVPAGAERVEILDAGARRFRVATGSLPDGYLFAASALLPDGDVMVSGGYAGSIRNTTGVWRLRRR